LVARGLIHKRNNANASESAHQNLALLGDVFLLVLQIA
tara:strand:+ start:652 stop:765 length:114 start_codon:yes stop_codon:yes gene_type:complete